MRHTYLEGVQVGPVGKTAAGIRRQHSHLETDACEHGSDV